MINVISNPLAPTTDEEGKVIDGYTTPLDSLKVGDTRIVDLDGGIYCYVKRVGDKEFYVTTLSEMCDEPYYSGLNNDYTYKAKFSHIVWDKELLLKGLSKLDNPEITEEQVERAFTNTSIADMLNTYVYDAFEFTECYKGFVTIE